MLRNVLTFPPAWSARLALALSLAVGLAWPAAAPALAAAKTADASVVSIIASPSPIIAYTPLTYTIQVRNLGASGPARSVVLEDPLPATVQFSSAAMSGSLIGPCSLIAGSPPKVRCVMGNVSKSATINVTVVVTPTASGLLTNTATVSSSNDGDPSPGSNSKTAVVTVLPTADLSVAVADDPDPVLVPNPINYTVTVHNAGPAPSSGAQLTLTLPSGVNFVSASPGCSAVAGQVLCPVGLLAVGASMAVTVSVATTPAAIGFAAATAQVSSSEPDPVASNNTDVETTAVNPADLVLTKTSAPDVPGASTLVTYTLGVANNGPSEATNVVVTDTLPGTFTLADFSPGCTPGGGQVVCAVGSLPASASVSFTVAMTTSTPGVYTNTAVVTALQPDLAPGDNSASLRTNVGPFADLVLSQSPSADPVQPGAPLTYSLLITNTGVSLANNVLFTDTLPGNVSFGSATPGCAHAGGVVTCGLASLDVGVTWAITVATSAVVTGTAVNTAVVASPQLDPFPSDNMSSTSVRVGYSNDLRISKSVAAGPAYVGEPLQYTLMVTNTGPWPASGVRVTDTLPGNAVYGSASAGCSPVGALAVCNLGALGVGASRQLTLTVVPQVEGDYDNSVVVAGNEIELAPADNTANVLASVLPAADLRLVKTASSATSLSGRPLTYTLTLVNSGPSIAFDVQVVDVLPAGLSYVSASPECANLGGTVTCSLVSLDVGADAAAAFDVVVVPQVGGAVTNTAQASSSVHELNGSNNTAQAGVTVLYAVYLSFVMR